LLFVNLEERTPVTTLAKKSRAHAPDNLRTAFMERARLALDEISRMATPEMLTAAVSAATPIETLAQAIGRHTPAPVEVDPLAPLTALNLAHREDALRRAGGALSGAEAGQRLGVSRQAIDKQRHAGKLLAVKIGSDYRYPACQFVDRTVPDGLSDVIKGISNPWVALEFLLAHEDALDGATPLEALRAGRLDDVRRLIRIERGDGFA
jgi:hypothetical protein